MPSSLAAPIVTITLALVCYTIGVWTVHHKKRPTVFSVCLLWLGLCFDSTGTYLMSGLVNSAASGINLHSITGFAAILLMLFHAAWGSIGLIKKSEGVQKTFCRYNLIIWLIWLVPFISGMFIGMNH